MIEDIRKDANERMQKSVESLQGELGKLRTGRAHPSLLEHITLDYFGTETPLKHMATINVLDSRTLTVTPFDKSTVQLIEKAIMISDLGLNPATAGEVIRVPLPPLTEERRKELVKVVKSEAENARIAVRNIRRDANQTIKDLLKEKEITEDEQRQAEDAIQKITDKFVAQIEDMAQHKEADLLSV